MKKRVGILTLNGYYNYGNRLQNYALQKAIENLGFDAETIRVQITGSGLDKKLDKSLKQRIRRLYLNLRKSTQKEMKSALDLERESHFMKFSQKWIKETEFIIDINHIPDTLKDEFDFFVAGSDQIWSPQYFGNPRIYFMCFAMPEQRISYAASFGASSIPNHLKEIYKEGINGIAHCSVREKAGVEIIENLLGKKAELVLDPTLLLSKEEWKILFKPEKLNFEKYILTYYLGEKTEEYFSYIQKIARETGYQIIDVMDKSSSSYLSDPAEFIQLIEGAELICTDSFHGTVFSILFEKNFIVFEKASNEASMFSRLDTLLSLFQLENRIYGKIDREDLFLTDYKNKDEILINEKNKSIAFLKKALGVN